MMSAVSGIRADSTTSTVTRQPPSFGSIPITDSGVRVVNCCNCCSAATTAFLAGSLGFVGCCCCFVDCLSEDDARSDDAERCELAVRSVLLSCGRFWVVCCLLADIGCRLRAAAFSAGSFVCWSDLDFCLFSPSGYGYGCDCNVIVSCELTSSAVEPILSPAQWLLRQKADQLHELGRSLQVVDGSRLDRSIAAQLPL